MTRLAEFVGALTGWRRWLLAFLAGLVSVAGLAPFFLWPVFFVTVTLLVWLLDGAALAAAGRVSLLRTAAWTGWCFGFGYFLGGL
ncbi:MAG: apolipoprotein N-acyltransferase, partial [Hyphomicrobiales bacterium]